eukprot:316015_1
MQIHVNYLNNYYITHHNYHALWYIWSSSCCPFCAFKHIFIHILWRNFFCLNICLLFFLLWSFHDFHHYYFFDLLMSLPLVALVEFDRIHLLFVLFCSYSRDLRAESCCGNVPSSVPLVVASSISSSILLWHVFVLLSLID